MKINWSLTSFLMRGFALSTLVAIGGIEAGIAFTGCSNLKGQDTASTRNDTKLVLSATMQRADALSTMHAGKTQQSGGAAYQAEYVAEVSIGPAGVSVTSRDTRSSTTQPTTVTIVKDTSDTLSKLATSAGSDAAAHATSDTKTGPTFSGVPNGKMAVDGLTVQSIESRLGARWPIFLGLLAAGLLLVFLPPPIQHTTWGVALLGGAAASLVLSDFWMLVVCGVAILIPLWPHIRNSKLITRIVSVCEDWKSDMQPNEKAAFNDSLAKAAGRQKKLVDKVRVQAKYAAPVVATSPLPEEQPAVIGAVSGVEIPHT